MKKIIIFPLLLLILCLSFKGNIIVGEELFKKDTRKTIPPSYGSDKSTFTSKHLSALVNQGRIDQAKQLVNLVGPQMAATVLVSMRLAEASLIVAAMDVDEAGLIFREMGNKNPDYGALMFAGVAESNPELGARLYNSSYLEEQDTPEIKSRLVSSQSILNESQLKGLLGAKDGEGNYILDSASAFGLLKMYAQADGNIDWGNTEAGVLLSSGRAGDFFYLRIAQALLVVTDLDRMRALAAMKSKDAARILKDMEPTECAKIMLLMESNLASAILAEDAISVNHAVEILEEIDQKDPHRAEEILNALGKEQPEKAEDIRRQLFRLY